MGSTAAVPDDRLPFLRLSAGPSARWGALALGLGLLGDFLLRAGPTGLNATLWSVALVLSALHLRAGLGRRGSDLTLAGMAVMAAAVFTLRAAPALHLLAAGLLFLVAGASLLRDPRHSGVVAWTLAGLTAGAAAAALAVAGLVRSARGTGDATRPPRAAGRAGVALRGALLATPFLLVLGALFLKADPVFARYVETFVDLGLEELASHAALTFVLAWVAGGLLYATATVTLSDPRVPPGPAGRAAGEVVVAILLIDLLFGGFLAVQARTLFGGREFVEAAAGLSYAEYARGGFFQLILAAAIALPTVLVADWLVPPGEPRRRTFVGLAVALVALVLAVLASAGQRMGLYLETYGLTELRLYAIAFMTWLALAGALLGATVLRGSRSAFPARALAAGWVVVLALAAIDPAEVVVRTNAGREQEPAGFDARHAASLGADAVPALLDAMDRVGPEARCVIAKSVLERWGDPSETDWRSWNLARWAARRSVRESEGRLREEASRCPEAEVGPERGRGPAISGGGTPPE